MQYIKYKRKQECIKRSQAKSIMGKDSIQCIGLLTYNNVGLVKLFGRYLMNDIISVDI